MTENPFFESWTTPFGIPPFDRIGSGHFPAAFDRGMEEQIAEIAAITGHASLKEIVRYTQTADRKRLARAASEKMKTRTFTA